jgi:tripartite-type tricarboxylate transporter receptor subunit TctC
MEGKDMTKLTNTLRSLLLAAAATAAAPALAQDYPTGNINFLVGFAPGGATDTIARVVGQELSERLGVAVVVENRGGASGAIASRAVSMSPADGYTVAVTTSSLAISETANPNKGFSVNDLRPVAIVALSPYVFSVNPSNPATTLAEFITNGREKSFTYGSPGVGSGPHIGGEYFFTHVAKVKAVHVPFGDSRPEVALLGGQIDALSISMPAVAESIKGGLLRGLAVAAEERSAALPDVPSLAESGYPGITLGSWNGFFVPAATPDAVAEKLNTEINEIMKDPKVVEKLSALGFGVMVRSLPDTEAYFKSEVASWATMVTAVGFKSE